MRLMQQQQGSADLMPWARFDDQMPNHRKVRPLTDGAFRLWVSAVCWCNANGTDGVVLAHELDWVSDVKRPRRVLPQLVANRLWEEIEGGWLVHDFLEYNPSSVEVNLKRQQATERQRRWRNGKAVNTVDASTGASRNASVDATPYPTRTPTTEDSLRSSSTARRSATAKGRGTRIPDDFAITDEMREWGRANVPGIRDPASEMAAFIDYWRAIPGQRGVKLDWTATWRNWMRRAAERQAPRPATNGHTPARPSAATLRTQTGMDLIQQFAAEEGVDITALMAASRKEITS